MKLFQIKTVSLFVFSILIACSSSDNASMSDEKNIIMNQDRLFCKEALKNGFFEAFIKFAAHDIVKLNEGQHPVIGKSELINSFNGRSGTKDLSWEPVYGEVSLSGDIGYTWGNWVFKAKDTTMYGNYFTVWKKMKDGSWKVALDGGNSTPPPAN